MQRRASILLVASLLLFVTPVQAAEPVASIPEPRALNSARIDFAVAINKLVVAVGKCDVVGENFHGVVNDLQRNTTVEIVEVGGRIYIRENESARWKTGGNISNPITEMFPDLPVEGATLVRVGDTEVNGVPATQYQIQVDPARLPPDSGLTSASIDIFIGSSDGYLHKLQVTLRGADPELGPLELETLIVISAFNEPFVVGRPAPELVDEVGIAASVSRGNFIGASGLPVWLQLVVSRAVAAYRQTH